jgi:hypothetical protein
MSRMVAGRVAGMPPRYGPSSQRSTARIVSPMQHSTRREDTSGGGHLSALAARDVVRIPRLPLHTNVDAPVSIHSTLEALSKVPIPPRRSVVCLARTLL